MRWLMLAVVAVLIAGCSSGARPATDPCAAPKAQAKAYNSTFTRYFAELQPPGQGVSCTPIQVDPGCRARTLEANLILAYPKCFVPADVAGAHVYVNR